MDSLIQSALTTVGQQQRPGAQESPRVTLQKTISGSSHGQAVDASSVEAKPMGAPQWSASIEGKVKEPLPPEVPRISSIDSYAESHSTAPSSSVDSSGRNSPVSTSTATSNFYFDFEGQSEIVFDDDDASELRNYSSPFHIDLRGRPALTRAVSLDANKRAHTQGSSSPDKGPMRKHLHSLKERSPRRSSYTFPFRSAHGWSRANSPTHPASAPGSAPDSRRGSTQSGLPSRPKSRLSVAESIYGEYWADRSYEPEQLSGDTARERTMENVVDPAEGVDDIARFVQPPRTPDSADISDSMSESGRPSRQQLGQKQTEDICEMILSQAFNVDLQDLTFATDALESVTHCLEELSHVVHGCRSLGFAAPSREVPSGRHSTISGAHANGDHSSNTGRTGRGKKRPSSCGDQGEESPDSHDRTGDRNGGGNNNPLSKSKKIKVEPPDNRYSCPYRKRNPLKFNIRDHNTCATTYFSTFADLKSVCSLTHVVLRIEMLTVFL
jgi:hypothetical protein